MASDALLDKLRKVLALTSSPVEGEAQAAAEHLQRLLIKHNLDVADLEQRGSKAPGVGEHGHDLGKAAFTWKLDLAEAIAEHYFCAPIVDRQKKTVRFVGRPDNVESLRMLYGWVIEQIKAISAQERRNHFVRTNEHIDPLRWQVNFGIGCVGRLRGRLIELKARQAGDVTTTALVVHHLAEVSDYLESKYGYRVDGAPTKWRRASEERQAKLDAMAEELKAAGNMEEYYKLRPWERPERVEEMKKANAQWEKRWARNQRRRKGSASRPYSAERQRKDDQAWEATSRGRASADQVNLEPFPNDGKSASKEVGDGNSSEKS